jgi:hypothetical protein
MVKEKEREESKQSSSRRLRAVLDRIEDNGMAVLLVGEDGKTQMDVPASLLPDGAKDGDHLHITIDIDHPARAAAESRIKKLQEELKGQSGTEDKKDFKL